MVFPVQVKIKTEEKNIANVVNAKILEKYEFWNGSKTKIASRERKKHKGTSDY